MDREGGGDRFALGLAAVVVVALAVRVAYTLAVDPVVPEVGDANAYHLLADNLAAGRGYIRPFDLTILDRVRPTAEYPPLLPALLAVPSLVGIDTVTGHRLATCVVGAAAVALIGLLGRRVGGPAVGLVAAGIAALHPMLFQADAIVMPESPFVAAVAAVLLLAFRAADRPTPLRLGVLGAAVGLAALTRAEALLLLPLLGVPVAWRAGPSLRLRLVTVVVLGTVVVVGPWTLRNAVRLGAVVPVSNNLGTALAGANCDATYGGDQLGLWRYDCFGGFDLDEQDEAEAARAAAGDGLRYAHDHPARLPAVVLAREARTWGLWRPTQQVYVAALEGRTKRWETIGTRLHWVLLALAGTGAVVLHRRRRTPVWPLLAPVAVVVLAVAVTYGNQRFRAGAEPSIAVLAAVTLVTVVRVGYRPWPVAARARPSLDRMTDVGIGGLELATRPSTGAPARFPCFDGLRAVAAWSVVVTHVTFISRGNHLYLGEYAARLDVGVSVFFVISGFLLYRPFAAAHLDGRPGPAVRSYLVRRALRIYPAYWLALTVIVFVLGHHRPDGTGALLMHYGLVHVYTGDHIVGGPIQQAWTLATEIGFYLFLPVYAAVLARMGATRAARARAQLWGLVVLYGASIAFRLVAFAIEPPDGGRMMTWLPANLDQFALGMLLAVVSVRAAPEDRSSSLDSPALAGLCWGLAGWLFWVVATRVGLPVSSIEYTQSEQLARQLLYGAIGFFLVAPAVFGRQDHGLIRRGLRSRPLALTGIVSYGIYLWHEAWVEEYLQWRNLDPFSGSLGPMLLAVSGLSLAAAVASYVLVERPALRLKPR